MLDFNLKILLVDDSMMIRAIITDALNKMGFNNIHEAENGKAGLEKLKEEGGFDFILSDWNMPKMSGLEFLKAVRANKELKNILFVMLSAESISDKIDSAIKDGADGYITKPFKSEKIKKEIENILWQHSKKKRGE